MPVVACPKCNKKYKLPPEQLGKKVQCSSCHSNFRSAVPDGAEAGGTTKPTAKSKTAAKSKSKSKSTAKKIPKTLEEELFASAPISQGAPDPLGNFVLEDPGFGALENPDYEDDDGDSNDDMFANRKHLMQNPALKDRNPYASPTGSASKAAKQSSRLRKTLLKHEGQIKSLAWFYFATGILGVLASVGLFFVAMFASADSQILPFEASFIVVVGLGAFVFVISALQTVSGWFLTKLEGWAKICTTIILVINLLGFPLGTIFSGYFLWVLHSQKGKQVFSKEYRQAIDATSSIRAPLSTLYMMLGFTIAAPIGYAVVKMIMG